MLGRNPRYEDLCEDSEDYMIFIYLWFSLLNSAGLAILLYTAYMAKTTQLKMIREARRRDSSPEYPPDSEDGSEPDWPYVVAPPEIQRNKKISNLEDIAEDDESDTRVGESLASSRSLSNDSRTISSLSVISTPASYSRSHSTTDSSLPRNSLVVPGKSSLKRTESQSRADYVLKMMTQGGNIRGYSSPLNTKEKYSPTGRKISVDSKVRLQHDPHTRNSVESRNTGNRIHTYENIPNLIVESTLKTSSS